MKNYIATIGGLIITPMTLLLAYFSTGLGHGNYIWTRILYPLPTMVMFLGPIVFILAIVQYPFYGWLIDRISFKGACIVLLFIHIIPLVLTFVVPSFIPT